MEHVLKGFAISTLLAAVFLVIMIALAFLFIFVWGGPNLEGITNSFSTAMCDLFKIFGACQ